MKRIVIIGAGFGGLAAAKALRHAKAEIWVIDQANHNLFRPLLYQVATTVLFAISSRISDPGTFEESAKCDHINSWRSQRN